MSRIEQVTAFAAVCAGCRVIGPVSTCVRDGEETTTRRGEALKAAERCALEAGWSILISGSICPGCRKIVAPPSVETGR